MLETVIALGAVPVAGAELVLYRDQVVEPPLPPETVDLGLRGSPNYELLRQLRPDLILSSPFYVGYRDRLERLAPVMAPPIHQQAEPPLDRAEAVTQEVGAEIGRRGEADTYLADCRDSWASFAERLAGFDRPLLLANFADRRHIRLFGPDSLAGNMLQRLGLRNDWTEKTRYSPSTLIGLEVLGRHPEAFLVLVGPPGPEVAYGLESSRLWQSLPAVRAGRTATIGRVSPYGAVPAADRFARMLTDALREEGAEHG